MASHRLPTIIIENHHETEEEEESNQLEWISRCIPIF